MITLIFLGNISVTKLSWLITAQNPISKRQVSVERKDDLIIKAEILGKL